MPIKLDHFPRDRDEHKTYLSCHHLATLFSRGTCENDIGSARSELFQRKISPNLVQYKNHMGVSENRGTPKSSILIGFSIINHPFWGTPIFGNTHILHPPKTTSSHLPGSLPKRKGSSPNHQFFRGYVSFRGVDFPKAAHIFQLFFELRIHPHLVRGFNPFEKYWSNWIISPGRGENNKYLKPPGRHCYPHPTMKGRARPWRFPQKFTLSHPWANENRLLSVGDFKPWMKTKRPWCPQIFKNISPREFGESVTISAWIFPPPTILFY